MREPATVIDSRVNMVLQSAITPFRVRVKALPAVAGLGVTDNVGTGSTGCWALTAAGKPNPKARDIMAKAREDVRRNMGDPPVMLEADDLRKV